MPLQRLLLSVVGVVFLSLAALAEDRPASHPPLRVAPSPSERPLADGPAYFVDAQQGDDAANGSNDHPWKTIGHAVLKLQAGDTLYLRGGTYYEPIYLALAGTKDKPITLRSYPGEQAIVDGGWREFFETPEAMWEPVAGGAPDEYRSTRTYPNVRHVIGSFGDSNIGLQSYYHADDLRAANEVVEWTDPKNQQQSDIKPLYCGPGLWYDAATGRIHIRLAHTHLPEPVVNYTGETDPRKLPLVLAPFRSTVVTLDGAEHVRLQDLVLRGAGYSAIEMHHAVGCELDNLTIWCGTYGVRASSTGPLKITNCGFHGSLAPWTFRTDASKRDYPGRPHRNISRLNTHALIDIDSGRESSVYATPQNDQWEIAHCEFTDAHDGVYLGAINVRFHHNLMENLQDDGIYLSPMYHRHRLEQADPELLIYQNIFRGLLTALAFGGDVTSTRDQVNIYNNIFDLRSNVLTGRPTAQQPTQASATTGKVIGDHGSPPWSTLRFYHNTCVMRGSRDAAMSTTAGLRSGHPRRVFNNIFLHLDRLPALAVPQGPANVALDGNLYWGPATSGAQGAFFDPYRSSEAFGFSQTFYPAGSTTHCRVSDPLLNLPDERNLPDEAFSLGTGSPAIDAAAALPADFPAPPFKQGAPDIGCLPQGEKLFSVGRTAVKAK